MKQKITFWLKFRERTLPIKKLLTLVMLVIPLFAFEQTVYDFSYTGSSQTWTVPSSGNYKLEVWGAQGGNTSAGGVGGYGGYASGTYNLTAGQTVYIYVGGQGAENSAGGFNGGGTSLGNTYGGSGGGASDIRIGGTALTNRVIVAGGGGGGSGGSYPNTGGAGGGSTGGTGPTSGSYVGGSGGTQSAGGAGGSGYGTSQAGSLGQGGGVSSYHNPGGGGGYYGGGSGCVMGGGGGSSYIGGVTSGTTTSGLRTGNGQAKITNLYSATITQTANILCNGKLTGALAVSVAGGTSPYSYLWSPNVSTSSTASNLAAGTYNVTVTDNLGSTTTASYTITQPAAVTATISQTNVSCNGIANGSATAVASGGNSVYTYEWSNGGNTATITNLPAGSYILTITDGNGCKNYVQDSLTVNTGTLNQDVSSGSNYTYNFTSSIPASSSITGAKLTSICYFAYGGAYYSYNEWIISGTNIGATSIGGSGAMNYTRVLNYTGSIPGFVNNGSNTLRLNVAWNPTKWVSSDLILYYKTQPNIATITEPSALTATTSQTNVSCNGGSNGTATVTPSGGTGTFSYSWTGGGSSATKSGLTAGTYTCTITDVNSCSITKSFTITEPTALTATTSQTNVSCNGGSNGSATVTPSGGTGTFSYSWTGGGSSATKSGLTAGTYTCTITDVNSCSITKSFTITQPAAITLTSTSQTNVSCNGGSNGAASVNAATGGTGAFTYDWTPGTPTGDGTTSVTGLTQGTWTCQVTDANSCTATRVFTITQPAAITLTSASQTNVSCNGGSNGAASVNAATGGTGAFTYDWTPGTPTGDGTTSVTGLTQGTWTCKATDANSCTATRVFTITQPTAITLTSASQTNVSCNGGSNGAASVNAATGGTGAFTYDWTPGTPTGDGTTSITGLAAGTWTCKATDANSCTATRVFTITQPTAITLTSASQTNVSCNGGSNGAASVNAATGGTGAFTYDWTPGTPTGDGTTSVTGLTQGTWTCQATDANSCTATRVFTITQPTAITLTSASQTNVSCNGGSNGAASVNAATGGTGAFTYDWTPGTPTGDGTTSVTGLTQGTWTCQVTDANSCTATRVFTITQPTAITLTSASQTNVSCNEGSNGAASVNAATGGTGAFTYDWTPGTPTGDGTTSVTGLTQGTWTCQATDANSCNTSVIFNITEPTALTATTSQTNVTCIGGSDGEAGVVATGGTSPYSYSWSNTANTATISGVTTGNYICTITDINLCTKTESFDIIQVDNINPTAVAQDITVYLDVTGNVNITAADVDNGSSDNCSIASMALNNSSFSCANLGANNVILTVTDPSGNSSTATAVITVADNINPVPDVASLPELTGECSITAIAPTATDNCAGALTATTTDPVSYTAQGNYTITWTYSDGNGNSTTQTQNVVITDVTNPVPDVASLPELTGECSVTAIAPTATDNCAGTITATTSDPTTYSAQGNYTITWAYSDGNGNTITQNQNVIIADVTAPTFDAISDITSCDGTVGSIVPQNVADNCSSNIAITYALTGATVASGNDDASNETFNEGTTLVTYTLADGNGNSSQLSFNVIYTIVDATVVVNGNTITANGTGTYQWYDCVNNTPITGETTQSFTATTGGDYAVIVTLNGCTDTSQCVNILAIPALGESMKLEISSYPNPTNDNVYVVSNIANMNLSVIITDIDGKEVYNGSGLNEKVNKIDVSRLTTGFYFMKVFNEHSQKIIKINKQ